MYPGKAWVLEKLEICKISVNNFFASTGNNLVSTRLRISISLAYLLLIYSTLGIARPIAEFLRSAGILKICVVLLFTGATLLLGSWRFRQVGAKKLIIRFCLTGVLLGIAATVQALPEERLHFITYGLLGWMVCWSVEDLKKPANPFLRNWLIPCLLVWLAGTVDELIQWWLPMRVFDVRDIVFNAVAAMNGIALFATGRNKTAN